MKSRIALAATLALLSTAAIAGLEQPAPVQVDLDAQAAQGDMLTASKDKVDTVFIGCGTRNYDDGLGGVTRFGFCQAEDAEGDHVLCSVLNPALVDVIGGFSDFSFITFAWTDDGAGNLTCTSVGFSTQSFYLGKTK